MKPHGPMAERAGMLPFGSRTPISGIRIFGQPFSAVLDDFEILRDHEAMGRYKMYATLLLLLLIPLSATTSAMFCR